MRAYSASSEEALRARALLKDWAGEGFLTGAQYQRMEQETACDLRRTNIFLRLVLFLFTLIIVGASVGLFFVVFLCDRREQTAGVFLLVFAAVSYVAAELAVSAGPALSLRDRGSAGRLLGRLSVRGSMGRFVSAVASYSAKPEIVVPAAGAIASLWIWHRFGLPYASLAAMIFVLLAAQLLDLVALGAAYDRRGVLRSRSVHVIALRPPVSIHVSRRRSIRSPKHSSGWASTWRSTSSFRRWICSWRRTTADSHGRSTGPPGC